MRPWGHGVFYVKPNTCSGFQCHLPVAFQLQGANDRTFLPRGTDSSVVLGNTVIKTFLHVWRMSATLLKPPLSISLTSKSDLILEMTQPAQVW